MGGEGIDSSGATVEVAHTGVRPPIVQCATQLDSALVGVARFVCTPRPGARHSRAAPDRIVFAKEGLPIQRRGRHHDEQVELHTYGPRLRLRAAGDPIARPFVVCVCVFQGNR